MEQTASYQYVDSRIVLALSYVRERKILSQRLEGVAYLDRSEADILVVQFDTTTSNDTAPSCENQ